MNGWKTTGQRVYAIRFKDDFMLSRIVDTEEDAIEFCEKNPQYYWQDWLILTKIKKFDTKTKRKFK